MKRSIKQPASSTYQFLDKLGEGAFGYIWKVKHIKNGSIYACKLVKNTMKKERKLLLREIQVLQLLKGKKGFTQLFASGSDENNTYFVMNLMGDNLEQVKGKRGNFKKIMPIGLEILYLLKDLHYQGIIHRDIKPENFVMQDGRITLIDFGLSKKFIVNNMHIQYKENKGMIGTARYASINALKGNEQSRRDDLESLGYMLIYLHQGNLPWNQINDSDKDIRYLKICKMKKALKLNNFFGLPSSFCEYMDYIKSLQFEEEPNYEYLIRLFEEEEHTNIGFEYYSPKPAIRLKMITTQRTSFRSPPKQWNSSRKLSFDEKTSDGSEIFEEIEESIKMRNFIVGIKQPGSPVNAKQF